MLSKLNEIVLNQPTSVITNINSNEVKQAIAKAKNFLKKQQSDNGIGVGLAANQIGIPLSFFIISVPEDIARDRQIEPFPETVFINPSLKIDTSSEQLIGKEGCFSIMGLMATQVYRYDNICVSALNEHGAAFSINAKGYLSRIIQHEADHLLGKNYLLRVPNLKFSTFKAWLQQSPNNDIEGPCGICRIPAMDFDQKDLLAWIEQQHQKD